MNRGKGLGRISNIAKAIAFLPSVFRGRICEKFQDSFNVEEFVREESLERLVLFHQ